MEHGTWTWIGYIKSTLNDLGLPSAFSHRYSIIKSDKAKISNLMDINFDNYRISTESAKESVIAYCLLKNTFVMENYLKIDMSRWERLLLVRFHMNCVQYLLNFPLGYIRSDSCFVCPCDGRPKQNLLHFILLCGFYTTPKKQYLYDIS